MLDRRRFLTATTTGLAAALTIRPSLLAQLEKLPASLPDPASFGGNEDGYWAALRKQFLIPEDEVYLNNGTVGSSPMPVLKAIFDCYHDAERMAQTEPED